MTRYRKKTLAAALLLVACGGDGSGLGTAPARLTLAPVSGVATAGAPLSPAVQVTALDAAGNTASSFVGSVSIALAANPGGAALSGTTSVNAVAGVATFANLVLNRSGPGYSLTATAGSLKSDTSATITVDPGPVSQTQSTVTATPATITASGGGSLATITVTVRDAFGNAVPGKSVVLAVSGSGNSVSQPAAPTGAGGVATGTVSSTVAEVKTVSATVGSVAVTQTASVTVNSGTASQLVFTTQPSDAAAGNVFAPGLVVSAQDPFGNLATGFVGTVTIAIASNPSGGTLSGTTTQPVSNGAAAFNDLSIDKTGAGYTLQVTASPPLGTATSTSFAIVTGPATKLAVIAQPIGTTGGATIAPAVQIDVQDAAGNRVTSASNSITVALGANPKNGTLGGTKTRTATAGIATFDDLTVDSAATGYTLTVTASGLAGATSSTFNISVGSAAKLGILVPPSNASGGATIAPAVQVEVRDAGGNRVTTATNLVTVAIGTNPNSGALGGTKSVAAASGVAAFSTLTIDSAATGYTLAVSATGLTGASSNPFNISVGPAAELGFRVQPTNTAGGATISPAVEVEVRDLGGNRVTSASTSITLAIGTNPASDTLSGTISKAAVSGLATFTDLSIDQDGTGYTLTAAGGGLTGVTSQAFNIAVGGATKLAFFVPPTNTAGGATIAPAVQVEVQDAGGNRVTGATGNITVALGTNPKSGSLGGTKTQPIAGGLAAFNNLTIDSAAAGYTLTAAATGLTGATSNTFNITVGVPAKLGFLVQPGNATGGVTIAPVQVEVRDAGGNRVTTATNQVTVAIGTNPNNGTLGGTKIVNAVSGIASFSTLTIDSAGTGYTLSATAASLTAANSSTFNISVGPAAKLGFRVQPSNTASGAAIIPAIQVEVRDAGGNRVTTASHTITLAIQSNPGSGNLSGTTARSAVSGVATFSGLSIDKSGIGYALQATSVPLLTPSTSTSFNVTAGAPDHLAFFVQPTDASAGVAITPAVQVEVLDAVGNLTNASTSITVAILDNPSGGALSGTKVVSAVAGVATFSNLNIDKAGTGYSLQATAAGLASDISSDFNIAPGAASRVSFFVEPVNTTAGASIAPAVQVEILDAFANRVGTANNSVTVALLNAGGATFGGTKTRTASGGVATFDNLTVDKSGNTYRLRATSAGLTPDTTATFAITPGAATQLVFTQPPTNAVGGAPITPSVQVTARDGLGNTDTSFTANITVAIGTNPGSGTLSGTTVHTAVSGIATFPGLSIDNAATGYTLVASAAGPSSATSGTFNITVGGAAKVAFGQQPTSTTGGVTISPAVTVRILDASGNLTASNASVMLAITAGTGTGGAHLSGGSSVTVAASSGVATFSSLSVDSAGTAYTLNATSGVLVGDTSSAFNVGVGTAAKVNFLVQPSNTPPGATITPAVEVEIRDAGGNRVTSDNTTNVTVAIGTGSGTLSGTKTQQAVAGLATFSDLSINNAGSYTLTAAALPLTGATSSSFDIVVGTATKLGFFVQPSNATGGATISPTVQVEIQDIGGNRVATATNSVTLAIGNNANGGALSGTKTVAAVAGVATFNTLSIDSAGTGYTLSATAGGLTGTTSGTFNITVGAATKLGFLVQPPNGAGGSVLTPAVKVEVRDAGGNRVTSAGNTVTLALGTNPKNGTLSGTTAIAAASGVATFSTLSIDSAATGYRIAATASGLTGATSNTFNITVGVAAKLGFLVQPTDAAAGVSITPAVKVEIRDAGGNRVTTASNSVTLAFAANPGGGTLSGTNPVSASSGVATFSNLSINKKGTGYALQATSGALTPATSLGFDIAADGVSASLSTLIAATDTIGQCAFSCVAGIHSSAVTVTVKDQFGNLVSGSPVVLSANGAGNGFSPSATGNTDSSGVFTAAFNSSVAEGKTISATAGGVGITQTAATAVMPVLVGAGDIADAGTRDDATASQLDSIPGVVFAAGDNAYPHGTTTDFATLYDPTWGRHKSRTKPVVGNHEYDSSGTAAAYFNYFTPAVADPLGNGYGYYSFDLGTWHVVVLNSDSGVTNPTSGPAQLAWLQTDLVGRTNQCVLAIWHRPLFTSGSSNGGSTRIRRLWQALEDAGAEIVINGHDHLYERFAPQDSLGNANSAGIREFIVGTGGGESHGNYVNNPPNVEASDGPTSATYSRGVLRLTFYDKSYRWEFLHAQGQGTYSDTGTAACH